MSISILKNYLDVEGKLLLANGCVITKDNDSYTAVGLDDFCVENAEEKVFSECVENAVLDKSTDLAGLIINLIDDETGKVLPDSEIKRLNGIVAKAYGSWVLEQTINAVKDKTPDPDKYHVVKESDDGIKILHSGSYHRAFGYFLALRDLQPEPSASLYEFDGSGYKIKIISADKQSV